MDQPTNEVSAETPASEIDAALSVRLPAEATTAATEPTVDAAKLEADRLQAEKLEAERLAELEQRLQKRLADAIEADRLKAEQAEADRLQAEKVAADAADVIEFERLEALEKQRVDQLQIDELDEPQQLPPEPVPSYDGPMAYEWPDLQAEQPRATEPPPPGSYSWPV